MKHDFRGVRFDYQRDITTFEKVDKLFTDENFGELFDSFDLSFENFDNFLNSHDLFHFLAGNFKIYISSSTEAKKIFIELNLEELKINQNKEFLKELKAKLELALSRMSEEKWHKFEKFINKFHGSLIYRGLKNVSAEFEVQDARSGSAEGSQKDKPEGDNPQGGVSDPALYPNLNQVRGGA